MTLLADNRRTTVSHTVPLSRLAEKLARDHADDVAILVDLSGISSISNRLMFRSMARFIEERTAEEPFEAVSLARNILVLLAEPAAARRLREKLELLSEHLKQHHYGSIALRLFDLKTQSHRFVSSAQRLMEQSPAPPSDRVVPLRDEPAPDLDSLDRVIDLQRALGQADLSNQSRRQVIWKLQPNMPPTAIGEENWISIDAIERITGIALRQNIWLFGKATELLDQRMIAQIMTDAIPPDRLLSINLHLTTIIGGTFRRLLDEKPADQIRQLMVEITLPEWRTNHVVSSAARQILLQRGIHICLDVVDPASLGTLTDSDLQAVDYLKLDAAGHYAEAHVAALQVLPPALYDRVLQKAIFVHCDDAVAVATGLAAGIRHFQGRGLAPLLEDIDMFAHLLGAKAADGATGALKGL